MTDVDVDPFKQPVERPDATDETTNKMISHVTNRRWWR